MIALLCVSWVLTLAATGGLCSAVKRRAWAGVATMLLATVVGVAVTAAFVCEVAATW